jgi:hypothetical protein
VQCSPQVTGTLIENYRHALLNSIRGAEFEMTTKGTVLSTHFETLLDKEP